MESAVLHVGTVYWNAYDNVVPVTMLTVPEVAMTSSHAKDLSASSVNTFV